MGLKGDFKEMTLLPVLCLAVEKYLPRKRRFVHKSEQNNDESILTTKYGVTSSDDYDTLDLNSLNCGELKSIHPSSHKFKPGHNDFGLKIYKHAYAWI